MCIIKFIGFPFLLQLLGSSDLNLYSDFNPGSFHFRSVVLNYRLRLPWTALINPDTQVIPKTNQVRISGGWDPDALFLKIL